MSMFQSKVCLVVATAALASVSAGCSEYGQPTIGGGASVVPQVVFLSSAEAAAGGEAAEGAAGAGEVAVGSIRGRVMLTGGTPTMKLLVKAGDDIKDIDWGVYAKTEKYYVKKFKAETTMQGWLVVDRSASMGWTHRQELTKFEYGVSLAAASTSSRS